MFFEKRIRVLVSLFNHYEEDVVQLIEDSKLWNVSYYPKKSLLMADAVEDNTIEVLKSSSIVQKVHVE